MKQIFTLKLIKNSFLFAASFILGISFTSAQELYVGSGASFTLKNNTAFTTSGTLVTVVDLGNFNVDAGNTWGSELEFVDGKVTALGTGNSKLPIGNNGVYAPVQADYTGDISAQYFNAAPNSGSLGTDVVAVADKEYWEMSGNAVVTLPWNPGSEMEDFANNNETSINGIAVVGYNAGEWNLVSAPYTNTVAGDLDNGSVTTDAGAEVVLDDFMQFTFGIDQQAVLAVNNPFLNKEIKMLSNPVKVSESEIRFATVSEMNEIQISVHDILGRSVGTYKNVNTQNRIGTLPKSNLKSGIYFLKFDHEGKQGVKKIIIE